MVTRNVDPVLLTALSGHFHPVLLIEAEHPDGTTRTHSGVETIVWNTFSWIGGGRYVRFEGPPETVGLGTPEASIRIAATVAGMLSERGKEIRNLSVSVWFGATTKPAGNVLIGQPCLLFTGYFDSRTFTLRRQDTNFEHDMVLGLGVGPSARAVARVTHSYEDQITAYPGDTAGRHLQNMLKRAANPPTWPSP